MRPKTLQVATLLVILGAGVVANPPPGQLFGQEIPLLVWTLILAGALVGGILSVVLAGGWIGYLGLGLLALPLIGPVHRFGHPGFLAVLVGAWAFTLHLELTSFQTRRAWWAEQLDGQDSDALAVYEAAYVRSVRALAGALLAGLVLLSGAYWALVAVSPGGFALSVEASHVEGMAAFTILVGLLVAGGLLAIRSTEDQGPNEAEEATP